MPSTSNRSVPVLRMPYGAPGGLGDAKFWEDAHQALYELGRGTLPLRV